MTEDDIEFLGYADLLDLREAIDRRLAVIEAENAAELAAATAPDHFLFTGDHDAVEGWAAAKVCALTGKAPAMSVFEGDLQGIYIAPRRLAAMGIHSRYDQYELVEPGEEITWTGSEFVVAPGGF